MAKVSTDRPVGSEKRQVTAEYTGQLESVLGALPSCTLAWKTGPPGLRSLPQTVKSGWVGRAPRGVRGGADVVSREAARELSPTQLVTKICTTDTHMAQQFPPQVFARR